MKRPKWSMDLRKARLESGLTQEKAAVLCGVSLRSWSNYEAGRHKPRPLLLQLYADRVSYGGSSRLL
jgi:transcriptional regulator with XRE-family HTH domain